jgi:hypothetical protein
MRFASHFRTRPHLPNVIRPIKYLEGPVFNLHWTLYMTVGAADAG